jgi:hypothetical protein
MSYIKEEIVRVANFLDVNVLELPQYDTNLIVKQVATKYSDGKTGDFLWEYFVKKISVCDRNAWKKLDQYIGNNEVVLFFNPSDESVAFKLNNGKALVDLIGESFGFEFYLTNQATDYVLCFNHHDYLIACGKSMEWLKKKHTI